MYNNERALLDLNKTKLFFSSLMQTKLLCLEKVLVSRNIS